MAKKKSNIEKAVSSIKQQTSISGQKKEPTPLIVTGNWGALQPLAIYESSVAAHTAINAVARALNGKIRCSAGNKEIISGQLYDLLQTIDLELAWKNFYIFGEFFFYNENNKRFISIAPEQVKTVGLEQYGEDFEYYQVNFDAGTQYTKDEIFTMRIKHPVYPGRGMSPLLAARVDAECGIWGNQYNSQFFRNSGISERTIIFPKGTDQDEAKKYINEYAASKGVQNGGAFKISGLIGNDIIIKDSDSSPKDGAFVKLSEQVDQRIAGCIGVPAAIMGFYDKTRFQTHRDECVSFAQFTIAPKAKDFSKALTEYINKYYTLPITGERKALDKKVNEVSNKVECWLDLDATPIFTEVLLAKFETVARIAEIAKVTPQEAGQYMGIDVPESKSVPIQPKIEEIPKSLHVEMPKTSKKNFEIDKKQLLNYRALVLKSFEQRTKFDIVKASEILGKGLLKEIKKDLEVVGKMLLLEAEIEVVKNYLNEKYPNSSLKNKE
jgi:hypothetical protein